MRITGKGVTPTVIEGLEELERRAKRSECGVLEHGFARPRCGDCVRERLVPFSCSLRNRGNPAGPFMLPPLSRVPDALRGRVLSLYALCWNLSPLGGLVAGGLAAAVSARFAVRFGGAMVAHDALALLSSRRLRAIRRPPTTARATLARTGGRGTAAAIRVPRRRRV